MGRQGNVFFSTLAALAIAANCLAPQPALAALNPFQPVTDSLNQACESAEKMGLAKCNHRPVPNILGKWKGDHSETNGVPPLSDSFEITSEDKDGNFSGHGRTNAPDGSYTIFTVSGTINNGVANTSFNLQEQKIAPRSVLTGWCSTTAKLTVSSDGSSLNGPLHGSCNGGEARFLRTEVMSVETETLAATITPDCDKKFPMPGLDPKSIASYSQLSHKFMWSNDYPKDSPYHSNIDSIVWSNIPTPVEKKCFVLAHYSDASIGAKQLNLPTSFVLGLSAKESGYGSGRFARQGNAYFGVKSGAPLSTGSIRAQKPNSKGHYSSDSAFPNYLTAVNSFVLFLNQHHYLSIQNGHYIVKGVHSAHDFAVKLHKTGKDPKTGEIGTAFGAEDTGDYIGDLTKKIIDTQSVIRGLGLKDGTK